MYQILFHFIVFFYFFALITGDGFLIFTLQLFFGTLHSDGYIFPFVLCFSLFFFSQLFVRPPQTAILLFCISLSFFSFNGCTSPKSAPAFSWASLGERCFPGALSVSSRVSGSLAPRCVHPPLSFRVSGTCRNASLSSWRLLLYFVLIRFARAVLITLSLLKNVYLINILLSLFHLIYLGESSNYYYFSKFLRWMCDSPVSSLFLCWFENCVDFGCSGLCCRLGFLCCGERGCSLVMPRALPAGEHGRQELRLQAPERRLSSCGARA